MHSKGPWAWGQKDNALRLYDAKGSVVVAANWRAGVVVEGASNARLIAAAPDLLAELKAMTATLSDVYLTVRFEDDMEKSVNKALSCARELIKRIEGEP